MLKGCPEYGESSDGLARHSFAVAGGTRQTEQPGGGIECSNTRAMER